MKKPLPVILDTDIGCDIDDTWALAMLLKSPELDLKMVVTEEDDTTYKAKLCAKMLQIAHREDVTVAVGIYSGDRYQNVHQWVDDYDLSTYSNLREDGVDALIEAIMNASEPVTVLCIGPVKNIAAAVEKEPRIAKRCKMVAVAGNIYNGAFKGWYPPLVSDWNVRCDLAAFRRAYMDYQWDMDLICHDVTGSTHLANNYLSRLRDCAENDALIAAMLENYEIWCKNMDHKDPGYSSCLFDTVGVYALITHENLQFERLPIYVNDESITMVDPERGREMNCAIKWDDKEKFYKFLTSRLCGEI